MHFFLTIIQFHSARHLISHHRLVVSKSNLRIQHARRTEGKKASKRLDVSRLNSMRQAFRMFIMIYLFVLDDSFTS